MKFRELVVITVINLFYFRPLRCETSRKVLVFGGNGFIGSETVSRLLKRGDEITMVNRGNWYFDSEERIKPFVSAHFKCNRDKLLEVECEELSASGYYDAVIDFSSYNARQIKQVVEILRGRVGLYIYISTDSIYEVCDKKHDGLTVEEDAVRPKSPKKRLQLKREEKYAHDKLACEEVLQEQRKEGGFPYVALRFPDVIGPRDNSFRFWTYQLWIKIHKDIHHPVHMPNGVSDSKFSLIHVEDAAKAIEKVLDAGPSVYNQAINLAFNEHFTLKKLLRDIANQLEVDDLEFLSEDEATWYSYPTVSKGALDISKAKLLLDWEPMTWKEALSSLCAFFEGAMTNAKMLKEKEMLLADFFENTVPEKYYGATLKKLLDIYGSNVLKGVDLGFGFDDTPEIAGPAGDSSSSAHDQKSSEKETVAHSPSDNGESAESEAFSSNQGSVKEEKRSDEL
ncbi:uncharacterized protein [Montipora foliosa]|uniref:uncharacterized protein n=1 Tax=Montipora foliosa TaxID=591990 RepID=UPI0035F16556